MIHLLSLLPPIRVREEPRVRLLIALRLNVIRTLGVVAVGMGASLPFTGGLATPIVPTLGLIPGWPWLWGTLLFVCGLVIIVTNGRRWHLAAMVAAYSATVVYALLTTAFLTLYFSGIYVPAYPAFAYAGWGFLHAIHADAERRVMGERRRERRRGLGV